MERSNRNSDKVDVTQLQQVNHSPFLADLTQLITVQYFNCRYFEENKTGKRR